jgi:hypothetical protein
MSINDGYYERLIVQGRELHEGDRLVDRDGRFGTVNARCIVCETAFDEHPPAGDWSTEDIEAGVVHEPVWAFRVYASDRVGRSEGYDIRPDEEYVVFRELDKTKVETALELFDAYL